MIIEKPFKPSNAHEENWYVLCVTPKKEVKIANLLKNKEIEAYCPITKKTGHLKSGVKEIAPPLFKSYVFVKISKRNRVLVFNVSGVTRYLFHEGRPVQVRDSEIEMIKCWINDGAIEEVFLSKYSDDISASIKNSFLQDRKAILKRMERKDLKIILKGMNVVLHAKEKEQSHPQKFLSTQFLN